jgi:hypothetical protein
MLKLILLRKTENKNFKFNQRYLLLLFIEPHAVGHHQQSWAKKQLFNIFLQHGTII